MLIIMTKSAEFSLTDKNCIPCVPLRMEAEEFRPWHTGYSIGDGNYLEIAVTGRCRGARSSRNATSDWFITLLPLQRLQPFHWSVFARSAWPAWRNPNRPEANFFFSKCLVKTLIFGVCFSLLFLSCSDGDPLKPQMNLRGKHFLLFCVICPCLITRAIFSRLGDCFGTPLLEGSFLFLFITKIYGWNCGIGIDTEWLL